MKYIITEYQAKLITEAYIDANGKLQDDEKPDAADEWGYNFQNTLNDFWKRMDQNHLNAMEEYLGWKITNDNYNQSLEIYKRKTKEEEERRRYLEKLQSELAKYTKIPNRKLDTKNIDKEENLLATLKNNQNMELYGQNHEVDPSTPEQALELAIRNIKYYNKTDRVLLSNKIYANPSTDLDYVLEDGDVLTFGVEKRGNNFILHPSSEKEQHLFRQ